MMRLPNQVALDQLTAHLEEDYYVPGTSEQVTEVYESYTGRYLREALL